MKAQRLRGVTLVALVAAFLGVGTSAARAATLPPALVALEQQQATLKLTSLQFRLESKITIPGDQRKIMSLLKLFGLDSMVSGEVTFAPPAGEASLDLFGLRLTLREVGKTEYVYIRRLARADHGRPWIRLGSGGLSELITVNGHPLKLGKSKLPSASEPALLEPPFAALDKTLAGAREVRELGSGTVDGQPVTSFLAVLEPSQLKSEAVASASRVVGPAAPPTTTMEVSLAPSGVPVRTLLLEQSKQLTESASLELPAVNFPLVIQAPPAARTISLAAFRKLVKKSEARVKRRRAAQGK